MISLLAFLAYLFVVVEAPSMEAGRQDKSEDTNLETGQISGVVLDADTMAPVAHAVVIVEGTRIGDMISTDGTFTLSGVSEGFANLRIMRMGYRIKNVPNVRVNYGEITELTIVLDKIWPTSDIEERSIVGTEVNVKDEELLCEIIPLKERYKVGDRPVFEVEVYNISRKMFCLVGAIDGSEKQNRYPHVTLTIEGPEGGIEKSKLVGCGYQNQLELTDFVLIHPWGTFKPITPPYWKPTDAIHARFSKPGKYKVSFYYSSEAVDYADWVGRSTGGTVLHGVIDTLKKVPRVTLSCSLVIEVEE